MRFRRGRSSAGSPGAAQISSSHSPSTGRKSAATRVSSPAGRIAPSLPPKAVLRVENFVSRVAWPSLWSSRGRCAAWCGSMARTRRRSERGCRSPCGSISRRGCIRFAWCTRSFSTATRRPTSFVGLGIAFTVPFREQRQNRHVRFATDEDGVWGEPVMMSPGYREELVKGALQMNKDQMQGKRIANLETLDPKVKEAFESVAVWDGFRLSQLAPDSFSIDKRTGAASSWLHDLNGRRARGLAFLGDVSGGLAVGARHFWEKYPAALKIARCLHRRGRTETLVLVARRAGDGPAALRHHRARRHDFLRRLSGGIQHPQRRRQHARTDAVGARRSAAQRGAGRARQNRQRTAAPDVQTAALPRHPRAGDLESARSPPTPTRPRPRSNSTAR